MIEADLVQQVAIEEQRTEKSYVEPDREPYEAERRESGLVQSLATHLRGRDHKVCRLQIVPKGEFKPLFTDLYDETADMLVEAKGSVTRESIRMAIGQLTDYGRFVTTARKVILLPSRPRPDLEELLRSAYIDVMWATHSGFDATDSSLTRSNRTRVAVVKAATLGRSSTAMVCRYTHVIARSTTTSPLPERLSLGRDAADLPNR